MSAYALTPLAKADIFQIWVYIADDSEEAGRPGVIHGKRNINRVLKSR
jgi:hypothetical protein